MEANTAFLAYSSHLAREPPPADRCSGIPPDRDSIRESGMAGIGAQLLVPLVSENPSQPGVGLPPLRRWDHRAAAAHGLAPPNTKARCGNDRETDQQAGVGTSPHTAKPRIIAHTSQR